MAKRPQMVNSYCRIRRRPLMAGNTLLMASAVGEDQHPEEILVHLLNLSASHVCSSALP
jgi:hypothetical protein